MFLSTLNKNTCRSESNVVCDFKEDNLLEQLWSIGHLQKISTCCSDFLNIVLTFTVNHQLSTRSSMQFSLLQLPQRMSCCVFDDSVSLLASLLLLSLLLPLLLLGLDLEKRRLPGHSSHCRHCSSPWQAGVLDSLASACRDRRAQCCSDKWVPCV